MKNKIVYLNGRFLTRPITGVERTAHELVRALDELIAEGAIDGRYTFILIYSGKIMNPISLRHIQLLRKGWFEGNLWEQLELPVYTRGSLLLSMCTISSIFKKRQLLIVHDASFVAKPNFFPRLIRKWYQFAIPLLGKKVSQLITVSEFSKSELIRFFGFETDRIAVIYNGAEHVLRFAEPAPEFQERVNAYKPYALAVSSLSANKNFKGLSDAIKQVDFHGYHMLIAGGAMKTLQHTALDAAVVSMGYVSDAELKYLYAHASLFIFPSFYEGFGIPPLEAMVLGCPVLASQTSAMPEILGDACAYFDPYKNITLAQELSTLLNGSSRLKELQQRGTARAARYDWKLSAKKLHLLIEKYAS